MKISQLIVFALFALIYQANITSFIRLKNERELKKISSRELDSQKEILSDLNVKLIKTLNKETKRDIN